MFKTTEIENLLSLCISSDTKRSQDNIRKAIADGLDWEKFIRLACEKGVAALTYQALKSHLTVHRALEALKISYLSTLTKNTHYLREQKKVLSEFDKNNIPVIPLKGIFLSKRLYGDITSRDESADFDLLVKEEDVERTAELLKILGYNFCGSPEKEKLHGHYSFGKPQAKLIDLHWDIAMLLSNKHRIAGLWQGAVVTELEGVRFYNFKPEELLLYLSAHLVNSDSFRTLRCICDINRLLMIYAGEIDWSRLAKKAKSWGLGISLYATIRLHRQFFGINFAAQMPKQTEIFVLKRFFIRIFADKKVVLRGGLRRMLLDVPIGYILFAIVLLETDSFRGYLAVFRRVIFPPKEIMGDRGYIARILKGIARLLPLKPKSPANFF